MRLMRILPAVLLALVLTGCGDDEEEPKDSASAPPETDALMEQAGTVLECTTAQDLPGSIGVVEGGISAIDLTTEYETIIVYVLESEEAAAAYQNPADLDQEQLGNWLIVGGAISPEHRTVIVDCIEAA
jgi:hypothetical protein